MDEGVPGQRIGGHVQSRLLGTTILRREGNSGGKGCVNSNGSVQCAFFQVNSVHGALSNYQHITERKNWQAGARPDYISM
jgi:hypothetical protein